MYSCLTMMLNYTTHSNHGLLYAFAQSVANPQSDGYNFNIWAPSVVTGLSERWGWPSDVYRWINEKIHPQSGLAPMPSMVSVWGDEPHQHDDCDASYSKCFDHEVVVTYMEITNDRPNSIYVDDPNSTAKGLGWTTVVNTDDWPNWTTDRDGTSEYATVDPPGGSSDYPHPPGSPDLVDFIGNMVTANDKQFLGTNLQPNTDYRLGVYHTNEAGEQAVDFIDSAHSSPNGMATFHALIDYPENTQLGFALFSGKTVLRSSVVTAAHPYVVQPWQGITDVRISSVSGEPKIFVSFNAHSNLSGFWVSLQTISLNSSGTPEAGMTLAEGTVSSGGGTLPANSVPQALTPILVTIQPIPQDGYGVQEGVAPSTTKYEFATVMQD